MFSFANRNELFVFIMESQDRVEINQSIENGSYFKQAREWHYAIYCSALAERSYLLILFFISCIIIFYTFKAINGILPLTTESPAVVSFHNTAGKEYTLIPLLNSNETYHQTNTALLRFHISEYLNARENYNANNFEENFRRIVSLSSQKSFAEYENFINVNNPDSPIAMYERHTKRRVEITSLQIESSNGAPLDSPEYKPDRAKITFLAKITPTNAPTKEENWVAEMRFEYKNLIVEEADKATSTDYFKVNPMEFFVTSYTSKRNITQ